MSDALKQKEELLSSKDAGKLLGYTHDYISKLCREGKMSGVQKGRVWYVTRQECLDFKDRHEKELEEKKLLLSQKFSEMRSQYESQRLEKPSLETAVSEDVEVKIEMEIPQKIRSPFVIPKQFVAASVLALILAAPSFLDSVSVSKQFADISSSVPSNEIVEHFDNGVASVINAQSEVVFQTANVYSFVQYLHEGYWTFLMNGVELSKGFHSFLTTLSDGYLTFYLAQGEAILSSFEQTEEMGYAAISGYELVGESFVVGTANVLESYNSMLKIDSRAEAVKKGLNSFGQNTTQGLAFVQKEVGTTLPNIIVNEVKSSVNIVISNIKSNLSYISQSIKMSSERVTAGISSVFTFDFSAPKGDIEEVNTN